MLPYSLLEDERAFHRGQVPQKTLLEVVLLSLYNRLDLSCNRDSMILVMVGRIVMPL